jgi:hypothetical protein
LTSELEDRGVDRGWEAGGGQFKLDAYLCLLQQLRLSEKAADRTRGVLTFGRVTVELVVVLVVVQTVVLIRIRAILSSSPGWRRIRVIIMRARNGRKRFL